MRRLVAALAIATVAACGSDGPTDPVTDSIEGVYSLRTINGQPLPFTVQGNSTTLVLTSDVLTMAANGSWTEALAFRLTTVSGETTEGTDSDAGTWTRAGGTVTLTSNENGLFQGSYANGSITFSDPDFVQVFTR